MPRLQEICPVPGVQDPTDGVADTSVVPAGRLSVTVVDTAGDGPALLTVSVYVSGPPAAGVGLAAVLVTERSAEVATGVLTKLLWRLNALFRVLAVYSSVAALLMVVPAAAGLTVTSKRTAVSSPGFRVRPGSRTRQCQRGIPQCWWRS